MHLARLNAQAERMFIGWGTSKESRQLRCIACNRKLSVFFFIFNQGVRVCSCACMFMRAWADGWIQGIGSLCIYLYNMRSGED